MTVIHEFITCACVGEFVIPYSRNKNKAKLIRKCRSHDTYAVALAHCNTFTEEGTATENERKKPQYQRR